MPKRFSPNQLFSWLFLEIPLDFSPKIGYKKDLNWKKLKSCVFLQKIVGWAECLYAKLNKLHALLKLLNTLKVLMHGLIC